MWEEVLLPQLDDWLAQVFDPHPIERDLDPILAALEEPDEAHLAALAALQDEERKANAQVENLRAAIADGADTEAIIPALNAAHASAKAARNRLQTAFRPRRR